MGFSQTHNIGYYIIVHKKPTKEETFEETRCSNTSCEYHSIEAPDTKFCPYCGSKIMWVDVVETNEYNYLDDKFRIEGDYLYDWFNEVEYIDMMLSGSEYKKVNLKKGQTLIVCNRNFDVETEDKFRNHPATKALIERVGECDIYFGFVQYQM